jgi:hypothetical protein
MELFESSNTKLLWMVIKKQTLRDYNFKLTLNEFLTVQKRNSKNSTDNRNAVCASHVWLSRIVHVSLCGRAAASRMQASISSLPLIQFHLHPNTQTKLYRSKFWIFKLLLSRKPFKLRQMFIWTFFAQGPTLLPPKIFTFPPESPCIYIYIYITRTKYLRSHTHTHTHTHIYIYIHIQDVS